VDCWSGTRKTRYRSKQWIPHRDPDDIPWVPRKTRSGPWQRAGVELELHQLDLRYATLRRQSAARERALLASLSEMGQQTPAVVIAAGEQDRYVLLDGYKRVRALSRLGKDTIQATRWELAEAEALLLERVMRSREADSALEEGWLLRELQERFKLSCEELARRFDKSESWVSRRMALVRALPESVQEHVRKGELVAHAAQKHLVPLARANPKECAALAAALAGHRLSSREVGTLCRQWARGSDAARALIIEDVRRALRAEEELRQERTAADLLSADLRAIAGIAQRGQRTLADVESAPAVGSAAKELQRGLQMAEASSGLFFTRLRKELEHARREHPDGDPAAG